MLKYIWIRALVTGIVVAASISFAMSFKKSTPTSTKILMGVLGFIIGVTYVLRSTLPDIRKQAEDIKGSQDFDMKPEAPGNDYFIETLMPLGMGLFNKFRGFGKKKKAKKKYKNLLKMLPKLKEMVAKGQDVSPYLRKLDPKYRKRIAARLGIDNEEEGE